MGLKDKVSVTDKSVRDLPQQIKIENDKINVISKIGRKQLGKYIFEISEWEKAKNGPSANIEYNYKQLISRKFREAGKLDETPEGEAITERLIDSQIRGIKEAIKQEVCSLSSPVRGFPEIEDSVSSIS